MDCVMCDGTTVSRTQPQAVERAGRVAVIRDVPVEVCDSCGEVYLDPAVASRLDRLFRGMLSGNVDQVQKAYGTFYLSPGLLHPTRSAPGTVRPEQRPHLPGSAVHHPCRRFRCLSRVPQPGAEAVQRTPDDRAPHRRARRGRVRDRIGRPPQERCDQWGCLLLAARQPGPQPVSGRCPQFHVQQPSWLARSRC